MNRTAETIKEALSMRQVAEFYGFEPDRGGFIHCPFHSGDHQGSLKIYPEKGGGFYCFGCKAHGSVIDFVMKYFELSFHDACKRLSDDFGLGLFADRQSYRERRAFRGKLLEAQRKQAEQERKKQEAETAYWQAFDLWRVADVIISRCNPSETGGVILPGYATAIRSIPQLKYELDLAEERRREIERNSGDT